MEYPEEKKNTAGTRRHYLKTLLSRSTTKDKPSLFAATRVKKEGIAACIQGGGEKTGNLRD